MTDATGSENEVVGLLLRRIRGLRQRSGRDRLEHYRFICQVGIRRLSPYFQPDVCTRTLLDVAKNGRVPKAEAKKIIESVLSDAGLKSIQVAARARRSHTKVSVCEQWLSCAFAERRSWHSVEIERLACEAGLLRPGELISRNSPLLDARRRLGIVVRRQGFGPGARYDWSLP